VLCYRGRMNKFSKMKVHWRIYNHCLFVSYLASVAFGWISDTTFLKISDKDWMWIRKKIFGYGSGVEKSISAHLWHRLQAELCRSWNAHVFFCLLGITSSKAALEQCSRAWLYFCRAPAVCRWISAFFLSELFSMCIVHG